MVLKSKIHRCTITDSDLNYEGSIGLGPELMAAADILEFERVAIWNITNGERFETYAIKSNPGDVVINGAAARKVQRGDTIIVASWGYYEYTEGKIEYPRPTLVFVDEKNKITEKKRY